MNSLQVIIQRDMLVRKYDEILSFSSLKIKHLIHFSACPVLIGNKWVGNKWIHERGQEFRRRCSLDPMA